MAAFCLVEARKTAPPVSAGELTGGSDFKPKADGGVYEGTR